MNGSAGTGAGASQDGDSSTKSRVGKTGMVDYHMAMARRVSSQGPRVP